AAKLALGKGESIVAVDTHDLAGRTHLRAEHRIDTWESRKREYRLLDRDMFKRRTPQAKRRERFPGHHLCGNSGNRQTDHLGDKGYCARGARIDLENVDVVVLDCELNVHQTDDLQCPGKLDGLTFKIGDDRGFQRMRRKRACRVAGMNARLLDML